MNTALSNDTAQTLPPERSPMFRKINIDRGPSPEEWQDIVEKIAECAILKQPFPQITVALKLSKWKDYHKELSPTGVIHVLLTAFPFWYGGAWSFKGTWKDGDVRGIYNPLGLVNKGYIYRAIGKKSP